MSIINDEEVKRVDIPYEGLESYVSYASKCVPRGIAVCPCSVCTEERLDVYNGIHEGKHVMQIYCGSCNKTIGWLPALEAISEWNSDYIGFSRGIFDIAIIGRMSLDSIKERSE